MKAEAWKKKKKVKTKKGISWCNIPQKAGSDYYENEFSCFFIDFSFEKFTQEIISSNAGPCL